MRYTHRDASRRAPAVPAIRRVVALALIAASATVRAAPTQVAEPAAAAAPAPAKSLDESSYGLGLLLGSQLTHVGIEQKANREMMLRGLNDALDGKQPTEEQRDEAQQFMRSARDALAQHNAAIAHEFLARNAQQPGIQTLPSGLQYRILATGDGKGATPGPVDQITVRYRAFLGDGTEFDRSDAHDRPAVFRLNAILKGWRDALTLMKPGDKWQLFLPPELGYGAVSPANVPPGALLIYELELLRVEPAIVDPALFKRPSPTPKADKAVPRADPPATH